MTEKSGKLIHIAHIFDRYGKRNRVLLRQKDHVNFVWYQEQNQDVELEADVSADNIQEALRLAARRWQLDGFRTLNCGFRYTLPERDEHGINALFHQMAASYGSMNGIYYDDELGNNCFVQNASIEARYVWQQLKNQGRL